MKEIKLTKNKIAIVDDEDYEWLSRFHWNAQGNSDTGCFYAVRCEKINDKRLSIYMHREVLGLVYKDGLYGDHVKTGDTLNNQKENLRIATSSQNGMNSKKRKNVSGFKGVTFDKSRNKWKAHIRKDYKQYNLGRFDTKEEAYDAYVKAARDLHGEFACYGE